MRWFGKLLGKGSQSTTQTLADDPRWQRFNDTSYNCRCCGQSFSGVFGLAINTPDVWNGPPEPQPNDILKPNTDALTEDFCIQDEDYFVRCLLPFSIIGSEVYFSFGIWGSLSRDNFHIFAESFNDGKQSSVGPMFSWMANALPRSYITPTEAELVPQDNHQRPILRITDEAHPYFFAQRDGITFDQLLDIYAEHGSDIRPHLTES